MRVGKVRTSVNESERQRNDREDIKKVSMSLEIERVREKECE